MQEMTKKILLLNLVLNQVLLIIIGVVLMHFIPGLSWEGLFQTAAGKMGLSVAAGGGGLLLLQWLFFQLVPKEYLLDEINLLLIEKLTLVELAVIFLLGAVAEEFLFRGVIQSALGHSLSGIALASLIFTGMHFRYWRKGFMVLEVFLMGMILGTVYAWSGQLPALILCHFIVNIGTAYLVKKGYMD